MEFKFFMSGFVTGAGITLILVSIILKEPSDFHKEVHTGVVECTDLPDGKVYCYKVEKK